jgi:hypothetical protein
MVLSDERVLISNSDSGNTKWLAFLDCLAKIINYAYRIMFVSKKGPAISIPQERRIKKLHLMATQIVNVKYGSKGLQELAPIN